MFLNMILGSSTETPLASGRVGIRIRGFTSGFRESRLVLVSELVSLAGLAGDGDTGDTIGITTTSCSIITATYLTAGFSSIATTSIAPVDFMGRTDFMAEVSAASEVLARRNMDSPARTPERSVASIVEEFPEAFLLVDRRASAEVSMAEVSVEASTAAEAATGKFDSMTKTRLMGRRELMRENNMTPETTETFIVRLACGFASAAILLLFAVLVAGTSSFAQESQARTFSSPDEATDALFQAVQKANEPALEAILGAGKEVTSSTDEEEDKLEREQFSKKYQQMHRLVQEPDGSTVLYIGAENWPFPVPLVSKNGQWYFDSDHGKQEILFRRIGENETTAMDVCEEFAMANNATAAKSISNDPIAQFAESLVSGTANPDDKQSNPYHGYYFRVLARNSQSEVSGEKKGGGLTLVAYPVDYKSSGVMTFVVTWRGIVFEKDLGPSTATMAPQIKVRTGSSWRPAAGS